MLTATIKYIPREKHRKHKAYWCSDLTETDEGNQRNTLVLKTKLTKKSMIYHNEKLARYIERNLQHNKNKGNKIRNK